MGHLLTASARQTVLVVEGRSSLRRDMTDSLERKGSPVEATGTSAEMQRALSTLELAAPMNSAILLQGETGTGTEHIARAIHRNSPRRDQPFVGFSAAAVPESLIEVELFGLGEDAAPGAAGARAGQLEAADGGTLFIEDIESIPLAVQARLHGALQERSAERVGDSRPFTFDVRVIAATNVDLFQVVQDGLFREDLFYRLSVVPITLPTRAQREGLAAVMGQLKLAPTT